jgi:hypothetical protein
MPPSSRTRRARSALRTTANTEGPYRPKVDAFGTVSLADNSYKARVINYADGKLAVFQEGAPTSPVLFDLTSDLNIKGRIMTSSIRTPDEEEIEFRFQKAGCGCETPRALRGGRNRLLEAAGV